MRLEQVQVNEKIGYGQDSLLPFLHRDRTIMLQRSPVILPVLLFVFFPLIYQLTVAHITRHENPALLLPPLSA